MNKLQNKNLKTGKNDDYLSDFSPRKQNNNNEPTFEKKEKKNKLDIERYRTNSFISKLPYYKTKFKFTENELLMIKKR